MNPYLQDILHNITTRLAKLEEAQPDGVMGDVRVQIHTGEGWIRNSQLEALIATGIWIPTTPKKEWVGLTDGEILIIYNTHTDANEWGYERAIEAKLKEKNAT